MPLLMWFNGSWRKILSFSITLSRHPVNVCHSPDGFDLVAVAKHLLLLEMQRFPPRATTFILTIHLLYVSVADFFKVFPVTLYACVCVCVSWDLELQFLVFLVHVTGWTIFVFRTEPSRSHLPKQTGTLLLPRQSERGIETESAGSQKNTTVLHIIFTLDTSV